MGENFAWYYRKDTEIEKGYFTHSFFNENKVNSDLYQPHIVPILERLKAIAVIQIRANMFVSDFYKNKKCDWHTDYSLKCKTSILYLNTCNGGTELNIDGKTIFIKSKANTMLIFDSDIEHRGTPSTDNDFRYIINFNYLNNESYT